MLLDMLLDLDQGSMTVWKNDVKLGVMLAEGLSCPYCWAIVVARNSVRIESAVAAASPTEEELSRQRSGSRLTLTMTLTANELP